MSICVLAMPGGKGQLTRRGIASSTQVRGPQHNIILNTLTIAVNQSIETALKLDKSEGYTVTPVDSNASAHWYHDSELASYKKLSF